MNKPRFILLVSLALILTVILTGCSGSVVPSGWPGVTVSQNTAYLASINFVYAINLDTQAQIWRYPADKAVGGRTFYAAPVLAGDQLIAGSYDHKLYSIKASTGQENWIFSGAKNRYIASPLVTDKAIFAPNADGYVYALDLTGKLLWSFKTEKPVWATPTLDDKSTTLYLASMDKHLYAISSADGSQTWKSPDLGGAVVASPTLSPDGLLYVGTFSNEMLAINAKDGSILWRAATKGWVWSSPALQNGLLIFGDMGGSFFALDPATGQKKWEIQSTNAIVSQPLVVGSTIYYTNDASGVYAVDMDGKPEWSFPVAAPAILYAPVVEAGDLLLVTPNGGTNPLIALNTSGTQKWAFTAPK